MKATIGAQGVRVASMPSTIAVVPHEQKGVRVASMTAAPMASQRRCDSQRLSRSVPT